MKAAGNKTVPKGLIKEILAGRCVAVVGAGFSAGVAPTWARLLTNLYESAPNKRHELSRLLQGLEPPTNALDYQAAAGLIRDCYPGGAAFEAAVQAQLAVRQRDDQNPAAKRLQWLSEIPFESVLTLNMDDLLPGDAPGSSTYRRLLREGSRWWTRADWSGRPDAMKQRTVKLHGDANGSATDNPVVLTQEAYRSLVYGSGHYASFLKTIMATRTVLYLGFSFTDAYINELRSEVLAMIAPKGPGTETDVTGYAVMPDKGAAWQSWFETCEGIEVLPYETSDGNHSGFDYWLEAIRDETCAASRVRALLARDESEEDESDADASVVWVDNNGHWTNTHGHDWFQQAKIKVEPLGLPADLSKEAHASARLLITRFGYGLGDGGEPEAWSVLREVGSWGERPPVLVFGSPDKKHEADNRREVIRRGAWEYATDWSELFGLIERLFGREVGTVG